MAKLYTGTGDGGDTGLSDGSRVGKDHPRVRAYGAVDELNARIGLCRAACHHAPLQAKLQQVQNDLFVLGGDLAMPATQARSHAPRVRAEQVRQLEEWIDQACGSLPALGRFVLPAGCESACRLHHARTACRTAEREAVALGRAETINQQAVVYLNRLGDLLFAWARRANQDAGVSETTWQAPGT